MTQEFKVDWQSKTTKKIQFVWGAKLTGDDHLIEKLNVESYKMIEIVFFLVFWYSARNAKGLKMGIGVYHEITDAEK